MAHDIVALESVSEKIDYGLTASATEKNTGIKFLRITDIQDDRVDWNAVPYCECSKDDAEQFALAKGDIVFARTGATTGKSYLIEKFPTSAVFASYLIRVRPQADVDSKFLSYFFQSSDYWHQVTESAVGAAQVGVNASKLSELKIPLPSLPEQRRIAALLDKADHLRRTRRYAAQLSDTFLQAVFVRMFGDSVTRWQKWDIVEIQDVTESLDSKRIPVEASIRLGKRGQYPYYGASGIIDYVDEYIFDEETLLVAEDGANLLARSTPIAFIASGKYWVNNHAHVLRIKDSGNILYLRELLNITDLKALVTGSAQPKLTAQKLAEMRIPLPPLALQQKFTCIVQQFERLRAQQREAERQAEHLFQTLLHRAFA